MAATGIVTRAWLEALGLDTAAETVATRAWLEALAKDLAASTVVTRAWLEALARDTAAPAAVARAYLEVCCSTVNFASAPVPTPSTSLSPFGIPRTKPPVIYAKPLGGLPPFGFAIPDFDIWRPGYAGAIVQVTMAGTTQPAPIYYDVALTQPALNPQVLQSQVDANGTTYGSWLRPVYTYVPYFLLINETDTTGVVYPPLTTLDSVDASYATATAPRGGTPIPLRTWLDRRIDVGNFGIWSTTAGSATNGATLLAAIGAAAAQGGAEVLIPAGTFPVLPFTLPQGVVLRGQGLSATTLQCPSGASVCVLGGDGAGLRNLVLDGVVLAASSVGVDMTGVANVVFEHVLVQRFSTGVRAKGCQDCVWIDFSISNCGTAADFRGDADASVTAAGSQFQNIAWIGGSVSLHVTNGLIFEVFDLGVDNLVLEGLQFQSNQCPALTLTGARDVRIIGCAWNGCLINWLINDGTNTNYVAINTCRNIIFQGGQVVGAQVNHAQCNFAGTCLNVRVCDASLVGCSINLQVPVNPVVFQDCYLDPTTGVTGTLTLFATLRTSDTAITSGITSGTSDIVAFQLQLQPGQNCLLEAIAVAKQENGINYGIFWEAAGFAQPGATLAFSSGTVAFTVPAVLSGQTSKAAALIRAKTGTTSSGSLTLEDITGTFIIGEQITDSGGGIAFANGPLTPAATTIDATGQVHIRAPTTTNSYTVVLQASGPMVQVLVAGAGTDVVAWQVKTKVVVN